MGAREGRGTRRRRRVRYVCGDRGAGRVGRMGRMVRMLMSVGGRVGVGLGGEGRGRRVRVVARLARDGDLARGGAAAVTSLDGWVGERARAMRGGWGQLSRREEPLESTRRAAGARMRGQGLAIWPRGQWGVEMGSQMVAERPLGSTPDSACSKSHPAARVRALVRMKSAMHVRAETREGRASLPVPVPRHPLLSGDTHSNTPPGG